MAATTVTTTIAGQLSTRRDVMSISASSGNNVVAIDTTSCKLDQVIIDNSSGGAQIYLRIWDTAYASVSEGTTEPAFILTAGAGETVEYSFAPAPVLDNALTAQVTTTSGYDASGAAVSAAATITFLTHD